MGINGDRESNHATTTSDALEAASATGEKRQEQKQQRIAEVA